MKRSAAAISGLVSIFSISSAVAQQPVQKWDAHVDFEAKPGSKRSIGEADFFLPLMQDGQSVFFGNARLRVADHDNQEGNVGAGYRRMLEEGWNLGGYGYFDRRRSTTGNYFNQVTMGAEALGRDLDFRGNVYLPQGDRTRNLGSAITGGNTTAALVGTTIQVTTAGSTTFLSEERALRGYDLEAGWRVPVWAAEADKQLRVYAGGYYFSDSTTRVSGPRVRAELTMAELTSLWKGAQLILGAEYQDDNARGGQGFVSARVRFPLGSDKNAGYKMNWQERRMTAPVVRDVDVVTQARTAPVSSTPAIVETATQTAGGQTVTVLNSGTTTGGALPGAVAAAGANSVVVLTGTFNTTATINLQTGQTLMGSGTLTVATPSGRTATLTPSGAAVTGQVDATRYAINMANNSTVSGIFISNTATGANPAIGVLIDTGVTGATVTNNRIETGTNAFGQAYAIFMRNGSSGTLTGNVLYGSGGATEGGGIFMNGATATIARNTITGYENGAPSAFSLQIFNNSTINAGSTGNVLAVGLCSVAGTVGSVSFTDGTTCP